MRLEFRILRLLPSADVEEVRETSSGHSPPHVIIGTTVSSAHVVCVCFVLYLIKC